MVVANYQSLNLPTHYVAAASQVSNTDRLTATLFLGIILHALVIFGIGFAPEEIARPKFDAFEVVLVHRHDRVEPEDAQLAAQANQQGAGDSEIVERPSSPLDSPFPSMDADVAAPAEAQAEIQSPSEVSDAAIPNEVPTEPVEPEPTSTRELLAAAPIKPERPELPATEPTPSTEAEVTPAETSTEKRPSAAELIASSMQLASLNAEVEQRLNALAKRPRRKYISASTKEYKYAAYLEAWRAKVERVGNLNYPDAARASGLSGSLLLDVALNQDGSVREITIRRSSGHKILDDAAVRIVELSAPFPQLPPNIRKEVDILHITRTWQFLNNARFSSR